jgi:hypothetical protein
MPRGPRWPGGSESHRARRAACHQRRPAAQPGQERGDGVARASTSLVVFGDKSRLLRNNVGYSEINSATAGDAAARESRRRLAFGSLRFSIPPRCHGGRHARCRPRLEQGVSVRRGLELTLTEAVSRCQRLRPLLVRVEIQSVPDSTPQAFRATDRASRVIANHFGQRYHWLPPPREFASSRWTGWIPIYSDTLARARAHARFFSNLPAPVRRRRGSRNKGWIEASSPSRTVNHFHGG